MFGTDKDGVVGDSTAPAPPYLKSLLEDEGAVVTEIAFLSGRLESAIADGKLLREQILSCEKRIVKGAAERAKLEIMYENCKARADLAEGAMEKGKALTSQLEELGRTNSSQQQHIEEMSRELEEKEASLQRLSAELFDLQEQVSDRHHQTNEVAASAIVTDGAIHKQVSELERDVARLSTQKTAAMAEIFALRDNIWRKANEISGLRTHIENKDNEISELRLQIERKDNEVSELRLQAERKDNEISEIGLRLQQVPWRVITVYHKCRRFIPVRLLTLAGRAVKVPQVKQ